MLGLLQHLEELLHRARAVRVQRDAYEVRLHLAGLEKVQKLNVAPKCVQNTLSAPKHEDEYAKETLP